MMLAKLAVMSRKIHRLLVMIIIPLGLTQMVTGVKLKYPHLVPFLTAPAASNAHSLLGIWFSIVLFLMMITGLFLYLYPTLQKMIRKSQAPQ
jgi:uncharacterized membrane protein YozB (DUF420 family)